MSQNNSFLCPLWVRISDVSFREHLKQQRGCGLQEGWITEVSCLNKISVLQLQHMAPGLCWRLRDKDCPNTFHSATGNSCHLFLAITWAPSPFDSETFTSSDSCQTGDFGTLKTEVQHLACVSCPWKTKYKLQKPHHPFLFYYKFPCWCG